MNITIYGSASDKIADRFKDETFRLAKKLSEQGHTIVFGGGANGLMGASARGVKSVGGKLIGVVPRFFFGNIIEKAFDDCDEMMLCETMHDRKKLLEDLSESYVVAPGGIGTFDEFFSVLTQKQLAQHNKRIALFDIDGYFTELLSLLAVSTEKRFITKGCADLYRCFTDMDELIEYVTTPPTEKILKPLKDN